jgi:hypothetical protein
MFGYICGSSSGSSSSGGSLLSLLGRQQHDVTHRQVEEGVVALELAVANDSVCGVVGRCPQQHH